MATVKKGTMIQSILTALLLEICKGKNPIVTIDQGKLQGITSTTTGGRTVYGFLGIPYAQPPVGDLRFKAPVAASSWAGILKATRIASKCMQYSNAGTTGSEDCLYLNVYTPQIPVGKNFRALPVMVFIHGGSFALGGSGNFLPTSFLDHDVILVTIAYRLDVLGFFSTGDEVAPGNYGLKDQILALEWVRDNIRSFGGDPNRVTLFGNSAGAASTHLLALSERAQDLFSQFILDSGDASCPWVYRNRTTHSSMVPVLAKALNCFNGNSTSSMVECIRQKNAVDIFKANRMIWPETTFLLSEWRPTDEPVSSEAVITDNPRNIIRQGKTKNVPWMGGVSRDEGLLLTEGLISDRQAFRKYKNGFDQRLGFLLSSYGETDIDYYRQVMKDYYFNDLTASDDLLLKNLTELMGDWHFVAPLINLANIQQSYPNPANAYIYSFEYACCGAVLTVDNVTIGVPHTEQTEYINGRSTSTNPADVLVQERMAQLWTSFAIFRRPVSPRNKGIDVWQPYTPTNNAYLQMGNDKDTSFTMKSSLKGRRMEFWKNFPDYIYL